MSRRGSTSSLVASPVLVGAVTVLVTIIAVFIAYNANAGLPFVPTYDLDAELPTGNKLVKGNEVRVGGFRVGVVDEIVPKRIGARSAAVISMKLDKTVEPLPKDTTIAVRPRSALGLKYVEITPGKSTETFKTGDSMKLAQAREGLELEDVLDTFQPGTRRNSQAALEGFGDAFTGRGNSINTAIQALNPLFTHLTPVMRTLSDPDTELDQFFLQIGRASAQVAPVARIQADLFANMATTFEAMNRDPRALQATIEKSPSTMDVAVRSFRVQRPFLDDFADLSRRLRPAVNELPRSLPAINRAFDVGTPVLPRTVGLNEDLAGAFEELDDLFANPNTLMAIRDLRTTMAVTRPALEFIAPYQTVCSYWNYFGHSLGEHQSQRAPGGTIQNQGVKMVNPEQPNTIGNTSNSRTWDVDPSAPGFSAPDGPYGATYLGEPAGRAFVTPFQPAIDAQGNADCQNGQTGLPRRMTDPYVRDFGRGHLSDNTPTSSNFPVAINNYPGLSGGTYVSRDLGIRNLQDVDKLRVR
jgi:virulence factor Mce-like protein